MAAGAAHAHPVQRSPRPTRGPPMDSTLPSTSRLERGRPLPVRVLIAVFLVGLAASVGRPAAQGQGEAPTAEQLFDDSVLQRLDLQVNSRDWAALRADFRINTYYPATVAWRGLTVRDAGIRSRGEGTRSDIKPGLRLDFNRYVSGQRLLGLKAIVLDNHLQDPSTLREALAMKLLAKMGLPAPRESHAEVYVNGAFLGVYAIVEEIDEDAVDRLWPLPSPESDRATGSVAGSGRARVAIPRPGSPAPTSPTGSPGPTPPPGPGTGPQPVSRKPAPYLYEYHWTFHWDGSYPGGDLDIYQPMFEPRTHENDSMVTHYEPIERTFYEINDAPDEQFVERAGARLDLANFIRVAAVQAYLAEWDGLFGSFGLNNFYLWREAAGGPFRVIPWDADNTFFRVDYPIDAEFGNHVLA
ncbi:MAG: hypothetical protein EHM24_27865, partial [Acidobacteria bacterium]